MISSSFPVAGRARRAFLAAFVSLIAAAGLFACASPAAANPVSSGETAVTLRPAVAKVLKQNGVSVVPVRPAKVVKGAVVFPVTGGQLDPLTAMGQIRHSGGLKFGAGKSSLVARSFSIRTAAGILTGKVGKKTVRLFKVDLGKAKVSRSGLGVSVRGAVLSLTGASAAALNKTFKVRIFKSGLVIGTAAVKVNFAKVKLAAKGSTDLTLDPETAKALTSLGVTPAPIGPAKALASGAISFPITGGSANTSSFAGSIGHRGGISLTAGSTTVALTDFRINVDAEPDLTALVGGQRVSILSLDLSSLKASVKRQKITLAGVKAKLTATAAAALNDAFKVNAFSEGLLLGTARVNAVAR